MISLKDINVVVKMDELKIYKKTPLEIIKGIPSFIKDDYYFHYFTKPELLHLLSLAERKGWKYAVVSNPESRLTKYLTDPRRLLFLPLLSLIPNSKILDLGAGLGSLSFPIAKRNPLCDVYAYDKTLEGLLLLNVIKEQEKLQNLHIARIDALDIPLDDSFFDLVLMVGVLEWVGSSTAGVHPFEAQKNALQEAHRVLKPEGQLLVAIENRFGHQLLKGAPDHSGLPYTSIMPRSIANWYTKFRLGSEYRTYTYSSRGYRKLLTEAGFKNLKIYAAFPDYRTPKLIFDVNQAKELLKREIRAMSFTKLAFNCMPDFLVRFLVPSFLIVAVK